MLTRCPILYDHQNLLIIHKPDGVLSHPNPGQTSVKCAFEGPYDFDTRCFKTPEGPVWLIHRLDQDTSGILVAARTEAAARNCREQFEKETVLKNYVALVMGEVRPRQGTWKDPIETERRGGRVRSVVAAVGTPNAKLKYTVRNFFSRFRLSLLDLELVTGKTHQIRVQAAFRRYPILGDDVYGLFAFNRKMKKDIKLNRLFLHAGGLEMRHPETGERIRIESPLPQDLREVLSALGDSREKKPS